MSSTKHSPSINSPTFSSLKEQIYPTRTKYDKGSHNPGARAANLSELISADLEFIKKSLEAVKQSADRRIAEIDATRNKFNELRGRGSAHEKELEGMIKKLSKVKCQIPFSFITIDTSDASHPHINRIPRSDFFHYTYVEPSYSSMDVVGDIRNSYPRSFQKLQESYHSLSQTSRLCLHFFLVFPENAIIKTSLLLNWIKAFQFLSDALDEIVVYDFVKPVYKKYSLTVAGYRMDELVRAFVAMCVDAQRLSHPTTSDTVIFGLSPFTVNSSANRVPFPKKLKILYLGEWQRGGTTHIELEPRYLKEVGKLNHLAYLSFRGVSMMKELPEAIPRLRNLKILDVKACHHLETVPRDIGKLSQSLTHLDMSECYLLDYMPKSLAQLSNLQVLKGFLVPETKRSNACTLQDLAGFNYLRKLSIYTSEKEFPSEAHLTTLQKFETLINLGITWRLYDQPSSARCLTRGHSIVGDHITLPFKLEKLDLQCAPKTVTRSWLRPSNFKHLIKLYIRGGEFSDLGQQLEEEKDKGLLPFENSKWTVKVLRLKYLNELKMDCIELRNLFPKLICLENVGCPKLTSIPCDESGVLLKRKGTANHS